MRHSLSTGLFFWFLLAVACSTGTRDVLVVAENQEQISQQIKKDLTYEEVKLLEAYAARTEPHLEAGLLPMGRTVGQMIDEERAYQLEVSGGETPSEVEATVEESESTRAQSPPDASAVPAEEEFRPQPESDTPTQVAAADEPAPPPPPVSAALEVGTSLQIRLAQTVSSKTNQTGDRFEAILEQDLTEAGNLLAPQGSIVTGKVTHAKKSAKVKGRAQLSITLESISVQGETYPLTCDELKFEAGDTKRKDALRVGIGAGAGAVIGAIAGGGKGAAIGTAIGGGAGTGAVLLTSGKEVEFSSEHLFEFHLKDPVEMRIVR